MASKKANPLHPEQIIDCFICAFPIDGEKRLYSYGVCGHKDVCSICYLRIRALQKKELSCPSCKTPLEKVICSKESNINFTDFTFWGDSIGPDFHFDERSQMFFPPNYYKEHVQMLWLSKCKLCSQVKRDSKGLRSHLHAQHNLEMCTLCIEHRNAFPSEHTYFSQKEYEAHLRHGDKEGAQGHPFCEFCRKRYYDKTAFFMHLQQEHFKCHICDREGILHKYYDTYDTLESHFRSHHHLCEDPLCIAKKYEVFSNAIDLAAHERQYHPGHQRSRHVPVSFQFKRRENDKQGQGASSSGNGDGIDDLRVDTSARFDAGLGGRAQSGQWQIELAGIPTDPRDEARSTGTAQAAADLRSNISLSALSVQEEEFPSLPGDSRNSNAVLWAHGVTSAGKRATQSRKESEFPSLPPSKGSTSDLKKAAFASKSNSSSSASSSHSNGGGVLSTIFSSGSVPSSTSATPATSTTIPSYAATPTAEDFPSMASGTKKAAVKASYSADSTFRGAVQENASVSLAVRMHMSREPVITRTATEVLTNSSPAVYPSLSANNKTVTKSASISSTSSVKKPVVAASASMSSWGSALGSAGIAVQPKKKEKKAGIAVAKLPFAKAVSSTSNRQIVDQDFIDESKMIGRVKSSSSLNEKYMAPASIKN